jgi:hypothetical protein
VTNREVELDLAGGRIARLRLSKDRKVRVEIETPGQPPFVHGAWNPDSPSCRKQLENAAHINALEADTLAAEARLLAAEAAQVQDPEAAPYGLVEWTEGITGITNEYLTVCTPEDVVAVLNSVRATPNVQLRWEKKQLRRLAMLDVDFHQGERPPLTDIDELGRSFSPSPYCWWRTHGGGLHALYATIEGYSADELAAGAAARVVSSYTFQHYRGTVEILARTRHPRSLRQRGDRSEACGILHIGPPDTVFACLADLSASGATEAECDEIMEEMGLQLGERLPHDQCPIDPEHKSASPNPVIVTEHGLFCHSCQGRGLRGMVSWGALRKRHGMADSAAPSSAPLLEAADGFVHFGHASYLMGALLPEIPERFRRQLYSALLKRVHGPRDLRLTSAFNEFAFCRGQGQWLHANTLVPVGRSLVAADVKNLSSVCEVFEGEDGIECAPIQERVTAHTNDGKIPGWTPIQGHPFQPIHFEHNTPLQDGKVVYCTPKTSITRERVSYIPSDKRISKREAESRISTYFPGINLNYLKALIIAMGCAESGAGMIPMIWATGESGSAKTTTVKICLEMYGEAFQPVVCRGELSDDRLSQAFGDALEKSRVALFDDFAKERSHYELLHAFFVRMDRTGFVHHKMYVGPTTQPVNSAVVLTDWNLPAFFTQDKQFGRRCHLVRLDRPTAKWEDLGHFVERWWRSTPELRAAADAFHSHIVDEFFSSGDPEGFAQKMARIGVGLVAEELSVDVTEQRAVRQRLVLDLILTIGKAPEPPAQIRNRVFTGAQEVTWGVEATTGHETISSCCTALVDSLGNTPYEAKNLLRVLQDFNSEIGRIFKLKPGRRAKFEVKDIGRRTYIRIVEDGKSNRSTARLVNTELFTTWPPEVADPVEAPVDPATPPPAPADVEATMAKMRAAWFGMGAAAR